MEDNTFGIVAVTVIGLLFFFGIGSIVASFFFDPKEVERIKPSEFEERYFPKVTSEDYADLLDDNESNSVIVDPADTFDIKINDIE